MRIDLNIYYVGQANLSIIIHNKKAIIYDCGTMAIREWFEENEGNVENYFKELFDDIEIFLVIISHDDKDHTNLLFFFQNFFFKYKKIFFTLNNAEGITNNNLRYFENFFSSNFDTESEASNSLSKSKIKVKLYLSPIITKDKNRKSIIMKLSGEFDNGESYSLLFTGDANRSTLVDIIKHYFSKNNSLNNNNNDNNKEKINLDDVKNFFSDIIFHMNPHHGAITMDSFIWSKYSIEYSKYPVLNVISSNPSNLNGKPSLEMIKNLIKEIVSNNEKNGKYNRNIFCYNEKNGNYYKNIFCVPHNISCNSKTKLFRYPSIKNGIVIPIFVTYDAISSGYNIVVDTRRMILRDNIEFFVTTKIDIPLYIYSTSEIKFSDEIFCEKDVSFSKELSELYVHYLAYINEKEPKNLFNELKEECVIKKNIPYKDFMLKSEEMLDYIRKTDNWRQIEGINNDIYNETKSYQILQNNTNIENFIKFSLIMKQSEDNIKEFLYYIIKNDDKKKNIIKKILDENKNDVDIDERAFVKKGEYKNNIDIEEYDEEENQTVVKRNKKQKKDK